ncbi:hypothetical protein PMAYCL1PPCAC_12131, partial [Pristionchus mayeri]
RYSNSDRSNYYSDRSNCQVLDRLGYLPLEALPSAISPSMGEDPDWRGSSHSIRRLVFIATLLLLPTTEAQQHSICGSIDIRNDARTVFNKENASDEFIARYMNCTILEGTFSLSMITNSSTKEEDFVTFPNLVEITGYLLVFNVKGLTTLSRIFPNLRVIGGSQLIMNYALIIYQNPDLKDVTLPNLRVIRQGGVRITENPSLCYVIQIDWKRMLFGSIDDIIVHDGVGSGAQCPDDCDDISQSPRCVRSARDFGAPVISCWNASTCQTFCPFDTGNASKTIGTGCLLYRDENGVTREKDHACHQQCIGGCYSLDDPGQCVSCAGYLHEGKCVSSCPPGMFTYLSRCVDEEECLDSPEVRVDDEWRHFKAVNSQCVHDCPAGYELGKRMRTMRDGTKREQDYCEKCPGECPKKCKGKALDTISMAQDLTGCNIIEGTLDIQLRDSSKMTMLTEALKDIEIIEGNLLVRFSPSLTSLSIFQKLREIRSEQLFQDRYALVIYENQNMNALFSPDVLKRLKIPKGLVQVQNNRMLCFKHVDTLMKGLNMTINPDDQSSFSNGDKAICDETNLELKGEKMMSEGFVLMWTPFNTSDIDHRKFLGYQVFYKRVDSNNVADVQIDQDRSVCADTWNMHFEPEQSKKGTVDEKKEEKNKTDPYVHALITHDGITPYTYYATYVQTKMVNHLGAKNARSNVLIVQTQFNHPNSPKITQIHQIGTEELEVEWEPPTKPNGKITHYVVSWQTQYRDISFEVKHACDAMGEWNRGVAAPSPTAPSTLAPPTHAQQTFLATLSGQGSLSGEETCSALPGCCVCTPKKEPSSALYDEEDDEKNDNLDRNHDFENAVQNIVFVPSCKYAHDPNRCGRFSTAERRKAENGTDPVSSPLLNSTSSSHRSRRRRRRLSPSSTMPTLYRIREEGGYRIIQEDLPKTVERQKRSIPDITELEEKEEEERMNYEVVKAPIEEVEMEEGEEKENVVMEQDTGEMETEEMVMPYPPGYLMEGRREEAVVQQGSVNRTAEPRLNKYRIKGLRHATTYQISVLACQDVDVSPTFCSLKAAYKSQKTGDIPGNDQVPVSSIKALVLNHTTSGAVFIKFDAPQHPNGRIHGFTVTISNVNDKEATKITHCVNASIFAGGVIMRGLADGTYEPQIITVTERGGTDPAVVGEQFTIRSPSFFTWTRILMGIIFFILLMGIIGFIIATTTKSMMGKKLGEYVRQTITANPEYLSQFDVYKQDEWELDRSSLVLGEEIGRGTFGKVFRGWTTDKELVSHSGITFNECAIKTVSEEANPSERLHFLIEASVMKQFNSAFIIHLYGVVSDGQPVLVVMEMMAKGNLRDYLRSRRPDAEENTEHLPVPTDTEIMEWAAQIADGMAYLEHLKFCHRDLAARNCMIGADDVVKIGDFGMARDIYYHEYYKPTGKRMMPVRWMAPESLKDGKFSLKSDVWAYGIVLYEMMTLAQQPYQGLANDEVFNYIGVTRRVLERPVDCPDFWYELMEYCWQYQPRERPTFRQIVECLCFRASEDFRQKSWVLNEAPLVEGDLEVDERVEEFVDETVHRFLCTDNRRGNEPDDFSDRGTELMHSEEEDSV